MTLLKKKLTLIFLGLCVSASSWAQNHLLIGVGQNMTNFKFVAPNDEVDENYNYQYSTSFNVGYAFSLEQGIYFQSKIGLRTAGASYVYDDFNYQWDIKYGEARLGVGYRYSFGAVYTHFAAEGYFGYALSANQRLFDVNRDMIQAETIERMDYGVFFSPGVGYNLTENIGLELDLNYMLGLGNLDRDEGQTTQNRLWGATVGLNIKL